MSNNNLKEIIHGVILDWSLNEVEMIVRARKKDSKSLLSMMTVAIEKYIEEKVEKLYAQQNDC